MARHERTRRFRLSLAHAGVRQLALAADAHVAASFGDAFWYADRGYLFDVIDTPPVGEACLGTISEIFDGDAPHAPRGCVAQAWGVSETLRAWTMLTRIQSRAERSRLTRGVAP